MTVEWADFLQAITERESKLGKGKRRVCQRCHEWRVNPPNRICWRCKEKDRVKIRAKRKKLDEGGCSALRCQARAMPGSWYCIGHGGT